MRHSVRLFHTLIVSATLALAAARLPAQTILTVAGGGTDDGRPATAVPLVFPNGIAVDQEGNLFVANDADERVRVVLAETGLIRTVAGNGIRKYSGDGGPATAATLSSPRGIAVDGAGNLFIADSGNSRVRRLNRTTGIITTVAGSHGAGYSGDGGVATSAQLAFPIAVAIDQAGNVFLSDAGNDRIRRVDADSGTITTFAGVGTNGSSGDGGAATLAQVDDPTSMTLDTDGNLYFAEPASNRVRVINGQTGIITTVAGNGQPGFGGDGGPATAAALGSPGGVSAALPGSLFIADTVNRRVRRVDLSTGIITTLAGTGSREFSGDGLPATEAGIGSPSNVTVDVSGNLFVESGDLSRVRRVDALTGIIRTVAGNGEGLFAGDGRQATAAGLWRPGDVLVDPEGNLYVGSSRLGVRRVDAVTGIITTVVGSGSSAFSGDGGPATQAGISFPDGLAMDGAGNLFISDSGHLRVRRVDAKTGVIRTVAGNGTRDDDLFSFCIFGEDCPATEVGMEPTGIAVDAAGNLYIADTWNRSVRKVDATTGIIQTVAGGFMSTDVFSEPAGLDLGPDDSLYIAEELNCEVRRLDLKTGNVTTIAGTTLDFGDTGDGGPATLARLGFPRGVAVSAGGDVYIADRYNYKVRKIDSVTGIITTLAGTGEPQFAGDGGPASSAGLALLDGIAVDALGNVYVGDETNDRVRKISGCLTVDAPGLVSPADGSQGVTTSPTLAWQAEPGAFSFEIFIDTAPIPVKSAAHGLRANSFAPSNLEPLTTYYWRVVAKGDPFCDPFRTAESPVHSFTTASGCDRPGAFSGAKPIR